MPNSIIAPERICGFAVLRSFRCQVDDRQETKTAQLRPTSNERRCTSNLEPPEPRAYVVIRRRSAPFTHLRLIIIAIIFVIWCGCVAARLILCNQD